MPVRTGFRKKILAKMQEDPKALWSVSDMFAEYPESTHKAVDNHIRALRIEGIIDRHLDKDVNNDFQFAIKVKIEKIDVYVKQDRPTSVGGPVAGKKKRKGQLLTAKEIRSMFAEHYNNMAKLEDSVMAIVDRSEMTDKEMTKIRTFLGR